MWFDPLETSCKSISQQGKANSIFSIKHLLRQEHFANVKRVRVKENPQTVKENFYWFAKSISSENKLNSNSDINAGNCFNVRESVFVSHEHHLHHLTTAMNLCIQSPFHSSNESGEENSYISHVRNEPYWWSFVNRTHARTISHVNFPCRLRGAFLSFFCDST